MLLLTIGRQPQSLNGTTVSLSCSPTPPLNSKLSAIETAAAAIRVAQLILRLGMIDTAYASATPIIIVAARGNKRDVVLGLDAGAADYIAKPFDYGEVAARIRRAGRVI